MVTLTIDNRTVTVPEGTTIWRPPAPHASRSPPCAISKGVNEIGACRLCIVEVEGQERLTLLR